MGRFLPPKLNKKSVKRLSENFASHLENTLVDYHELFQWYPKTYGLSSDESIAELQSRVDTYRPKALAEKKRQEAIKASADRNWTALDDSKRAAFAMASDREAEGRKLFSDYGEPLAKAFYDKKASAIRNKFEEAARDKFYSLTNQEKDRWARASYDERQAMFGTMNLPFFYLALMNSQADFHLHELRSQEEEARNNDSFSSFDVSSTFGGGSFGKGGGAGGSW